MEKNIEIIRRDNLKEFIKQKFKSISDFSRQFGTSKSNISTLLSGSRGFTTLMAEKIELAFALPNGYLSEEDHLDFVLSDFINAKYYNDMKFLVGGSLEKNIKLPLEVLRGLKLNSDDDILVTFMNDDLMTPTIKNNEMILIDCSQQNIELGDIYLIEVNGFYRVRRLFFDNGYVSINIDNLEEKQRYVVKDISISNVKVIGKLIGTIRGF